MADRLTKTDVLHVAKLARLQLTDEQAERYQGQLTTVLEHFAKLGELDVDGVEPMAHPIGLVNRLDDDHAQPSMPTESVLGNAPAVEGDFIAVPKVLDDSGG